MFSIIVPSYNRNTEIEALLHSLERQTEKNFEVVVVDDCSKNPVKIDRTFSFPLRLIRNEINRGAAESRNIGAREAENEWLLFLDDDDRFTDEKCAVLSMELKQDPTVNFIYHPAECLMVNENFTYITSPKKNIRDLTLDNILLGNKVGGMPMIGIKKDFFFKIGGLSTELKSLEDYEFILKAISDDGFSPKYIDRVLTKCTFHTKRASVSTNTEHTEQAVLYMQKRYVKTEQQAKNFKINSLYMLAHPNIMNLSRKAAVYYFKMFMVSHNIKHLFIAAVIFISPKLAVNLKRFI